MLRLLVALHGVEFAELLAARLAEVALLGRRGEVSRGRRGVRGRPGHPGLRDDDAAVADVHVLAVALEVLQRAAAVETRVADACRLPWLFPAVVRREVVVSEVGGAVGGAAGGGRRKRRARLRPAEVAARPDDVPVEVVADQLRERRVEVDVDGDRRRGGGGEGERRRQAGGCLLVVRQPPVPTHVGVVAEAPAAQRADEVRVVQRRRRVTVTTRVPLQVVGGREARAAHLALVVLVGVRAPHVAPHVARLGEGARAERARQTPPAVDVLVARAVRRRRKPLAADLTHVATRTCRSKVITGSRPARQSH